MLSALTRDLLGKRPMNTPAQPGRETAQPSPASDNLTPFPRAAQPAVAAGAADQAGAAGEDEWPGAVDTTDPHDDDEYEPL
jgi:hypothetical protein